MSTKKTKAAKPVPTKPPATPVPVTLLSGFLGAGKTTLLEHILRNKEGLKCAVVVNDMASLNIDAMLVKGAKLLDSKGSMVEMHNGCICCTLREDLLIELRNLAASGKFDYIVIESTGISEPMQVAEAFFLVPKDSENSLEEYTRLDNCVTVVDASTFYSYLQSNECVTEEFKGSNEVTPEDERRITHLLADQVEFANLILLNKTDLVDPRTLDLTVALLKRMNPSAEIVLTKRSEVDIKKVLFTNKFDVGYAKNFKAWMMDISSGNKHTPETLEYGIASFIYKASAPFHPTKLYAFITKYFILSETVPTPDDEEGEECGATKEAPPAPSAPSAPPVDAAARTALRDSRFGTVWRSKGFVWLGNPRRLGAFAEWNHAGNIVSFGFGGGWEQYPTLTGPESIAAGQQIVFIGQDLRQEALTAELNECLLSQEEQQVLAAAMTAINVDAGQKAEETPDVFPDPFEDWVGEDEDEWEDDDGEEDEEDD